MVDAAGIVARMLTMLATAVAPALAQIPPPPGRGVELGPLFLNYYGLAIAIGVLAAILLARRRYAVRGGNPDLVDRTAIIAVVAGFIGARVGYVMWRLDDFADRPLAVFAIWEGGLVFFGGLLFGVVAGLVTARKSRMDLPAFFDSVAPALPLAQAIGRWGNYFNQELYGRATEVPWGLEVDGQPTLHHPTFLYESLANLVLVAVIILVGRTERLRRGALIFVYLIGYALIRFFVELLRIDTEFRLLGLSRNNWAAIGVVLIGVAGLVWWQRRREAASPRRRR